MHLKIDGLERYENQFDETAKLLMKQLVEDIRLDEYAFYEEIRPVLVDGVTRKQLSWLYKVTDEMENIFLGLRYNEFEKFTLFLSVNEFDYAGARFEYKFNESSFLAKMIPLELKKAFEKKH